MRLKTFGGLAIHRDGAPLAGAAAQRRRLALLALLDGAGDRGLTREKLLGLLWPEAEPEKARRVLAQSLYALRRELGSEDLFLGTNEVRINPAVLRSDRTEFADALAAGRLEEAVAVYEGPYLDGFYLNEAPEFERWVETERAVLAHDYAGALERLAERASAAGDFRGAVGWWRRLAAADPLNSRVAVGLMRALANAGDRPAALQHARVFETLLREELDVPPDPEVVRLAGELRREDTTRASTADRPRSSALAEPR
ncbi:MAG TPA: BTAD domain-containing putative transcriptional regulator, partial [Gemmatimonadales bacterium]|nr:BTAD domain-containing putative transcriptional regulator [Gemmatimonadales bacterium]